MVLSKLRDIPFHTTDGGEAKLRAALQQYVNGTARRPRQGQLTEYQVQDYFRGTDNRFIVVQLSYLHGKGLIGSYTGCRHAGMTFTRYFRIRKG